MIAVFLVWYFMSGVGTSERTEGSEVVAEGVSAVSVDGHGLERHLCSPKKIDEEAFISSETAIQSASSLSPSNFPSSIILDIPPLFAPIVVEYVNSQYIFYDANGTYIFFIKKDCMNFLILLKSEKKQRKYCHAFNGRLTLPESRSTIGPMVLVFGPSQNYWPYFY